MGMFDSVIHPLKCKICGSIKPREIQTKDLDCTLAVYRIGDFVEPPRFGHYFIEGVWNCGCTGDSLHLNTCYIELLHGMIIGVHTRKPKKVRDIDLPGWLVKVLKRNNEYYRLLSRVLERTKNVLQSFREGKQEHPMAPWWYKAVSYTHLTLPTICSV